MKPPMFPILALILATTPATARIGETPQECGKRYGQSRTFSEIAGSLVFCKNGFRILTTFHDGKCDSITFTKLQPETKISEDERLILLESNGKNWKTPYPPQMPVWGRDFLNSSDGCYAAYGITDPWIQIATSDYLKRKAAAKKAKETQNLKGF